MVRELRMPRHRRVTRVSSTRDGGTLLIHGPGLTKRGHDPAPRSSVRAPGRVRDTMLPVSMVIVSRNGRVNQMPQTAEIRVKQGFPRFAAGRAGSAFTPDSSRYLN